jgi:hypothetical protein
MTVAGGVACTNCGSAVVAAYCADCGERQPTHRDFTTRALAAEVFHDVTSIDGRVWRSIVALLTKPGLLTREWFEGRRGRYVKPFSLFVMLNVAFFIVQPHTALLSYKLSHYLYGESAGARSRRALVQHQIARTRETPEQFAVRFNASLQDWKKSLLIFCTPIVALLLTVLYIGKKRFFAEHLVFSVHAYAFLLVILTVLIPLIFKVLFPALLTLGVPLSGLSWLDGDNGIGLILGTVLGGYLYFALRRVYGDGRIAAALRAAVVFIVIGKLVNVYHDVLFYTTLYSL